MRTTRGAGSLKSRRSCSHGSVEPPLLSLEWQMETGTRDKPTPLIVPSMQFVAGWSAKE